MKNLLKNKSVVIALAIGFSILILVIILSPKKNLNQQSDLSSPVPSAGRTELIDLSKEKRDQAMIYVAAIESKLPLSLEYFQTSVGIVTSINIYRLGSDPAEVVRLEIYGLSYLNQDANPSKNPNVTAYKESYLKGMEILESRNIDPKKLIFIYGDKEYVRKTTQLWIDALKLKP
jgi:hypothetical protein